MPRRSSEKSRERRWQRPSRETQTSDTMSNSASRFRSCVCVSWDPPSSTAKLGQDWGLGWLVREWTFRDQCPVWSSIGGLVGFQTHKAGLTFYRGTSPWELNSLNAPEGVNFQIETQPSDHSVTTNDLLVWRTPFICISLLSLFLTFLLFDSLPAFCLLFALVFFSAQVNRGRAHLKAVLSLGRTRVLPFFCPHQNSTTNSHLHKQTHTANSPE